MVIDSHMHINSIVVDDKKTAIKKINNNDNIEAVINVGLNFKTSKECVEMSNGQRKFYTAIGIHPLYIENEDCNKLLSLYYNKVIAIGEIGLDDSKNNYIDQRIYLIKQIMIANELKLPVIIHASNTNKEIINIFENYAKPKYGCVFHCFQPDLEVLDYIIENGYYISFAGKITYKTAKKSIEVLKAVPLDRFIVETDSPYISPEPYRDRLNESSNIKYIIDKISKVKELSVEEVEEITNKNTKTLFKKMQR